MMRDRTKNALVSTTGSEGVSVVDGSEPIARSDVALAGGVALTAFVVYLLTLSRGVLGGDAGELQFVPPILGLTHPTGYPLQVLVHHLWSYLPLGTVAYRLNLLDALFAAAAVGVVTLLARACGLGKYGAALAGLGLAFGELWWSQAVRGDKYTLNGLFLALVLVSFVRWRAARTDRRLFVLAFAFGLSLTHHRSMLLLLPALGVGLMLAGWRPWPLRKLVFAILLALAPLLLYAYVPWAGARGLPPGSWPVDTPSAFVNFLLDLGYTSQIRPDAAFGGRLVEEAWVLVRSFGPLGAILGLAGLAVAFRRDWRLALVLLLAFLPQAILGASYLLESNYALPRHWVFFLPAFTIWSVWVGYGVDAVMKRAPTPQQPGAPTPQPPPPCAGEGDSRSLSPARRVMSAQPIFAPRSGWGVRFPAVLFAAILLIQAGTAWSRGAIMLVRTELGAETMDAWRQDFQRSPVAERFGRLSTALADRNAIIVGDWEQATVLWYFQRVEGVRPDLEIRYPIERLDAALADGRASGRTVYITRTLPGVESRGVTSSVGPLIRVSPAPHATEADRNPGMRFEGGLTLVRVDTHGWRLRPGGVLPFTVVWRADAPLTEAYAVSVRLIDPSGSVLAAHDERHPALGTSPTNAWPIRAVVGDYHELPLGIRLRPEQYTLQVIPYRIDPRQELEPFSMPVQLQPPTFEHPLDLAALVLAARP